MPEIEVRPATIHDARTIADIHASVVQAAWRALVPDAQPEGMPMDKRIRQWRDAIEFGDPQVQVAVQEGLTIGFVGYDRSRDPKSKATTGEIWAIYVREQHWGQGAGVALWDAARDGLEEEGCTHVTIWLPLANERALRFHELAGFKRELNTARTAQVGGIKLEEIRLKRAIA